MAWTISARDLWFAKWEGLCRLAWSLGVRVKPGPEFDRRSKVVDAVSKRMVEEETKYWSGKKVKKRVGS